MNRPQQWVPLGLSLVMLPISLLGLLLSGLMVFILTTPDVKQMRGCFEAKMNGVAVCPSSTNYARFEHISPYLRDAVVVSEDTNFFGHHGFDLHEIVESFNRNLRDRQFSRGGSTITQQLAKNAFLDANKSLWRKAKEAYLTLEIERHFTKQEILERYLNMVEFGPQIFGVKAAAAHYFQKSPRDLNLLESAFLAFLLPNPKKYSESHRKGQLTPFAAKMLKVILLRMEKFQKVDPSLVRYATSHITEFPWRGLDWQIGASPVEDSSTPPVSDSSIWEDPTLEFPTPKPTDEGGEDDQNGATEEGG